MRDLRVISTLQTRLSLAPLYSTTMAAPDLAGSIYSSAAISPLLMERIHAVASTVKKLYTSPKALPCMISIEPTSPLNQ
jgi:hypothetical protein